MLSESALKDLYDAKTETLKEVISNLTALRQSDSIFSSFDGEFEGLNQKTIQDLIEHYCEVEGICTIYFPVDHLNDPNKVREMLAGAEGTVGLQVVLDNLSELESNLSAEILKIKSSSYSSSYSFST